MSNSESRTFGNDLLTQYTVIVPAYNEEERIAPTLEHILAHIKDNRWSAEVIVVDDGSNDATAAIASRYERENSSIRVVRNPVHRGKGHSIRTGIMQAAGNLILLMDADLPASMPAATALFQELAKGADVAIASRWLEPKSQYMSRPLLRKTLSRCFNWLARLLLGLTFKDTQCGVKAFTHNSAQLIFRFQTIAGWAFDPEVLVIAKDLGLVVKEVSVDIRNDQRSKLRLAFDGISMLCDLLKIAFRQLYRGYPSSAAPCFHPGPGPVTTRTWQSVPHPRVMFALLVLLTLTAPAGNTGVFQDSRRRSGASSFAVSRNATPQKLRPEVQGPRQYLDQSFSAEEFDLASDHD